MAMLTEYSDIRISRLSVPPIIPAVQGDTGRQLVFTPTDYTIPDDCTATYYIQKPSGNAVYNNATIEDGKVICDLTAQALAENGDNYGQIRIMKDEEVVTSFDFVLLVKPFRGIDAIESTTEMNIFDKAVEQAEAAIEAAAQEAEEYISQAIDATLTIEGKAADAKAAGDAIRINAAAIEANAEAIEDVADAVSEKASADGTYPNLTAGTAEQLLSDTYVEDSTPYILRRSKAGSREYDELVGGSIVYNQGVNSEASASWHVSGGSGSFADGVYTFTASASGGGAYMLYGRKVGHIYYHGVDVKLTTAGTYAQLNHYGGNPKINSVATTAWQKIECIYSHTATSDSNTRMNLVDTRSADWDAIQAKNFMSVDLTQMFGSAVAQHMADVWTQDAQAGCKLFRDMMGDGYLPYNSAGELMSVSGVSAHVMRDADNNIIGNYPLDSSLTLRGVPKVENGKICYDGDIYASNGTVTRRYGIVDLGTLDWASQSLSDDRMGFYTGYNTWASAPRVINNATTNAITSVVSRQTYKTASSWGKDVFLFSPSAGTFPAGTLDFIFDASKYADATAFKTAMNGVYLVYELATPITESATPYQHLQIVDAGGTEEYVTTGLVPVGHNTKYPTDLVAKLDGLPSDFSTLIAPTETGMTATRNYNTGALFIVANVLYKATANIANGGAITPGTNCLATTLAEVISALA